MKIKKPLLWTISVIIFGLLGIEAGILNLPQTSRGKEHLTHIPTKDKIQKIFQAEGKTYYLINGKAYALVEDNMLTFAADIYDPGFYDKHYIQEHGLVYAIDPKGQRIPTMKSFQYDFEHDTTVLDLFSLDKWTKLAVESPKAKHGRVANELGQCVRAGKCVFKDNRLDLSKEKSKSGGKSLKFYSVSPTRGMTTAKASISNELFHFVKGDNIWISAWYYLEIGRPLTILDLETTWMRGYPGVRVFLSENRELFVELKAFDKPLYKQSPTRAVIFPKNRWVHVKVHLMLSDEKDGVIQLWQDGMKIIDVKGRTLPLADTLYNSIEFGITANPHGEETVLYVDDILISGSL